MNLFQKYKTAHVVLNKGFRLEYLKLLCIYLISMCYDIITGLIDTNIRRLYMYDKPGRLCRLPHKSRMADSILFAKENVFCTTFVSAIGRSACRLAYG